MKDDNTPTVDARSKTPSRKLRLRLETAKSLRRRNEASKKVRRKTKGNASDQETDPAKQTSISRIPRIKKNTLAKPPTATTKYKRRQVNKTWLPTHLWHTKRAHLTRPTEPLWRLAIPLRPTEKSYRPSHRAAGARGCISWDTSYVSTVACLGTEHTLDNLLKGLSLSPKKHTAGKDKKWKAGLRFAEDYIHTVHAPKALLGPALVIWADVDKPATDRDETATSIAADSTKRKKIRLDRKIFIRVHPSCFKDFWDELLQAAKMQKPQVLVEDLRFEIGSIHITGPASTEALLGVLRPHSDTSDIATSTWTGLAGLSNPGALPDRVLIPLDVVDPRLSHPPRPVKVDSTPDGLAKLTELVATWPLDDTKTPNHIASYKARWLASTRLPSQKSLNRRKAEAGPGMAIKVLQKDPAIPALLLAHRAPRIDSNAQGSWTVLLPWCCVDAVWRSLQYYPISSGGTPRFGGLLQTQQMAFEQMVPWFPADMPGTIAGKAWERLESQTRFDEWLRRPPSRRLRYDLVDLGLGRRGEIGRGWMCDWPFLFADTTVEANTQSISMAPDTDKNEGGDDLERRRRRNTSSPLSSPEPEAPTDWYQVPPIDAAMLLDPNKTRSKKLPAVREIPALATVRIRLLTKGTPQPGARIYRLPLPEALISEMTADLRHTPSKTPSTRPASTLPASAEVHTSTQLSTTTQPPPAAQRTRILTSSDISTTAFDNPTLTQSIRDKWLSIVPTRASNGKHRNTYASHHAPNTDADALFTINVFPRNASQAIIDEYNTAPSDSQIEEFRRGELLREIMAANPELEVGDDGVGKWDVTKGLVECPEKGDLVGFVTSGGYNLREGRGTAVGGVWVQRVREGWFEEERRLGDEGEVRKSQAKAEAKEWLKRLCVVRNSGSAVGRLGVWEVCD